MSNNQVCVYQIDTFADQNTSGSPTGVVLQAAGLDDRQKQGIARRVNASHTAFVAPSRTPGCDIDVQFFTAGGKIKNCGHATIATHFLLALQKGGNEAYVATQKTETGIQKVWITHHNGLIQVSFKQNPITFQAVADEVAERLLQTVGITTADLADPYPIQLASPGANRFLLPLKSRQTLADLAPDFSKMRRLCQQVDSIGCFAFTLAEVEGKWTAHGRMFAPGIGVDEDIINGNSSGCVGAYLVKMDQVAGGGPSLSLPVYQGHRFGSPGKVMVKVDKIDDRVETFVGGTAVFAGQIAVTV